MGMNKATDHGGPTMAIADTHLLHVLGVEVEGDLG
jgi:hypothetical protein